jgi:hypothetical protein
MQQTIENTFFKFIPSKVNNFNNVVTKHKILDNHIYQKYEAIAECNGELIICNDVSKMKKRQNKIMEEDYQSYLQTLNQRDTNLDQWIYNIIDGVSEQDSILFRDDCCIVIPSYMWDGKDSDFLHILCLPTDKNLRTIRSLESSHIPLLKHMKQQTLITIKEKFDVDAEYLKMFFHYEPSTYHLHIHFVNVSHKECPSSVEYSHDLNAVMRNIDIFSDYYKFAVLNVRR